MKFDYRRSITAHKISHRRLLSPRVGSRVRHSRHREPFMENVSETPA